MTSLSSQINGIRCCPNKTSFELEAVELAHHIAELTDRRRIAEEEESRLAVTVSEVKPRTESVARTLVNLPPGDLRRGNPLKVKDFTAEVSRVPVLTQRGKVLMERFLTLMLAGELPILEGGQAEDFLLVAEVLIAADRLIPCQMDSTILTADDIWYRPGSSVASPVAQASILAMDGQGTFLVQLRSIELSAARAWYPALAAPIAFEDSFRVASCYSPR